MKVLMVLTSHDQLGNTGRKTGFWLEELAPLPITLSRSLVLRSHSPPQRGVVPHSIPRVTSPNSALDLRAGSRRTPLRKLSLTKLFALTASKHESFDTVFYPGGHGPMWDLAEDKNSVKLIESFLAAGKPIALVCHAPGALRHVKTPDGKPLVQGKKVTGFTDGEEEEVGLTKVVPFLVEGAD